VHWAEIALGPDARRRTVQRRCSASRRRHGAGARETTGMTAHRRGVTTMGDGRARRALGSGQRRSGGGRRARGSRDVVARSGRRREGRGGGRRAGGRGEAAVGRARSAGIEKNSGKIHGCRKLNLEHFFQLTLPPDLHGF
jgi:hypothetical protein